MSDLPEPARGREGARLALSAAWLVPLVALAIAGGLAWRHYAGLGPRIEIVLPDAAGVEAGRTPIRLRDIEVGRIESVGFENGLDRVVATARLAATLDGRVTENARFWMVRPQVSGARVSGLETLFSGTYLAMDAGEPGGAPARRFEALVEPPLTPPGTEGARARLYSPAGATLGPGAPVLFKGIEVGRVETRRLSEDGGEVEFELFVEAPHHRRLGPGVRFWNASGVTLEVGAEGVRVETGSLAALLQGGVAFDRVVETPPDAAPPERYRLHPTERAARESVFADAPGGQLRLTARFDQSVRGLRTGAPVEYRGVRVGEVEELTIDAGASLADVRIVATLLLEPRRIGVEGGDYLGFFARSVEQGLRARLAAGNIVTGALYVELVELPDAAPSELDLHALPHPRLPTTPSALDALQNRAETLLARITDLPIEALLERAIGALGNVERLTGDPALAALPGDLAAAAASARAALAEIEAASLGARLGETVGAAQTAASGLEAAAGELPELVRRLTRAAAQAETAMAAVGPNTPVNTAALEALREVRAAARAVSSLAQALERRPNSIILGR